MSFSRGVICGVLLAVVASALVQSLIAVALQPGQDGAPLGAAFTYQGRLEIGGQDADGPHDFEFRLFDDPVAGTEVGPLIAANGLTVIAGLFAATLDFGAGAFQGEERYLEVKVRPAGGGGFETLGRQRLTATPYAIFASGAPWAGIQGIPADIADGDDVGWALNGNAGTTPGTDFIGTSDNAAFEVRVNGEGGWRIEPTANINHPPSIIGGHANNSGGPGAFIGGGGRFDLPNLVTGEYGAIGGGINNESGAIAFVGGGSSNTASANGAFVGAGIQNVASNSFATVAGGRDNMASGQEAFVGGGAINVASGSNASVLGGVFNTASGDHSVVLGHGGNLTPGADGSFLFSDPTDFGEFFTTPNAAIFDVDNGLRLVEDAGSVTNFPVGSYFRDNAIIAWGKILVSGGNPVLNGTEHFNVSSVSKQGTGHYRVILGTNTQGSAHLLPIAIAEIDVPPLNAGSARIVSIDQRAGNSFDIFVQNGSGTPVDNDVAFIVTGR